MALRIVSIDRDTPLLMPPSIQEWVARDDIARLVVDSVELIEEHECRYNWRGSGSEQYPPRMMLALLIYCYAHGIFSSRKIERASYRDVAVRFITGDTHPDHDTIASFRRENGALIKSCFVRVLALARRMKILRLGDVAIDGSMIEANASKRRVKSRQELQEELLTLEKTVEELTRKAEEIDQAENRSPETDRIPMQLTRAQERRAALRQALEELEQTTRSRAGQRKKERQDFDHDGPGEPPASLAAEPPPNATVNTTDPDARLLPGKKGGYAPAYNVQVAVQAQSAAPMIVAADVCQESNDRRQLEPMVERTMENQPESERILVDSGYDNSAQIYKMERKHGVIIYCPPEESRSCAKKAVRTSRARQRTMDYRQGMRACMKSEYGRRSQRIRATSAEPVIGWIKKTLGFDRFHLRGQQRAKLEWNLVCLGFNIQLLHRLGPDPKIA